MAIDFFEKTKWIVFIYCKGEGSFRDTLSGTYSLRPPTQQMLMTSPKKKSLELLHGFAAEEGTSVVKLVEPKTVQLEQQKLAHQRDYLN
ncbi:hypothetical protein CHS0354_003240 [Potamilus streckersoni]|uniref:Uncharacterized protein n=1 Tax=Potamilus streckersoni TaxID=2493646 RepID=A0AAE0RYK6_9BIVA|nr:hypothetical protein CHS0354_003240 [Potamilus streckersoni]